VRPRVPPYFDQLLAARRAGHVGRDVHLGYWDDPPPLSAPCGYDEFQHAQARLTQLMIERASLAPGQRVLDVGCGFGGLLDAMNARLNGLAMTGVNIDRRQLAVCQDIVPRDGNSLTFAEADACALPFPAGAFDRIFCVEAMFHFTSRATFLTEAARVLRTGGYLVLSDIPIRDPGPEAPWDIPVMEDALRFGYGPWPELWIEPHGIAVLGYTSGLTLTSSEDWSAETLPGYRITAPLRGPEPSWKPEAGDVMRWLHVNGWLRYVALRFRKV
jgi:MPBQ/MSBQ methyltransferase